VATCAEVVPKLKAFLQDPDHFNLQTSNDAYEANTGEALTMVDEIKQLANTFMDDKNSSIAQEAALLGTFNTLMTQKNKQLGELTTDLGKETTILNKANQDISEHELAERTATGTLEDEQKYLTQINQQMTDNTAIYNTRKADRAAESKQLGEAIGILQEEDTAFLQYRDIRVAHKGHCYACTRVAAMLRTKAGTMHSELLASAAAQAGSADALAPVITQLEGLVTRLDQEAKSELEHKNWCDTELTESNAKKLKHEGLVTKHQKEVDDGKLAISQKESAIKTNEDAVTEADTDFDGLTTTRNQEKADYGVELRAYQFAIQQLNNAITKLSQFYASGGSEGATLLQEKKQAPAVEVPSASEKVDGPAMETLDKDYARKGLTVVDTLKTTRQGFEKGQKDLEDGETTKSGEYENAKTLYKNAKADLVSAGNGLTSELQTAQSALTQSENDLESNQNEVTATENYLKQVGSSCSVLVSKYADRVSKRTMEKKSLNDAITLLKGSSE